MYSNVLFDSPQWEGQHTEPRAHAQNDSIATPTEPKGSKSGSKRSFFKLFIVQNNTGNK